ncbi:hypothetical protein R6Q57_016516 [Mikania cordata]
MSIGGNEDFDVDDMDDCSGANKGDFVCNFTDALEDFDYDAMKSGHNTESDPEYIAEDEADMVGHQQYEDDNISLSEFSCEENMVDLEVDMHDYWMNVDMDVDDNVVEHNVYAGDLDNVLDNDVFNSGSDSDEQESNIRRHNLHALREHNENNILEFELDGLRVCLEL